MSSIICEKPSGERFFHENETEMENWLQPACKKSFVAIVGQSQIGKTFILKRILRRLKEQPRYKYVFYICLRRVDCSDKLNFLQLLTRKTSGLTWIDWKCSDPTKEYHDQKLFKKVVARITGEEQHKVCIILDHFEKSNFSHQENWSETKSSFNEEATAGYFISRILFNGFGNGLLLTLLNPWQFFQLKQDEALYPRHAIIWVEGIDHTKHLHLDGDKKLVCDRKDCNLEKACLGFAPKHDAAKSCSVCKSCHQDNCHNEIQSLCYVPYYYNLLAKSKHNVQRSTVTVAASVLIDRVIQVFRRYTDGPNNCLFKRIGKFAWEKYLENEFLFDENDLQEHLTWREINIFFSVKSESEENSCGAKVDLVFFFAHVLLQDLLASLWLLSLKSDIFEKILKENRSSFLQNDGKFAVIFEFMCDICSQKTCILKNCRKSKFWKIPKINFETLENVLKNS